jgi:hypothetical protein
MNKKEILAMKPGPELDKMVAEIFDPGWDTPAPFSTNIAYAWEIAQKVRNELFSHRRMFFYYLQDLTRTEVTGTGELVTIAWPDVFWYITPETICKAALLTRIARLGEATPKK